MNILLVTPWFPNRPEDQQGNFVLDSVEALCAQGHVVHVLVTRPYVPGWLSRFNPRDGEEPAREMQHRGFSLACSRHLSIPRNHLRFVSNWLYARGCAGQLEKAITDNRIELVHAHTEPAGVLAQAVAGKLGVPVVTTLHGVDQGARFRHGLGQSAFITQAIRGPARLVLVGAPLLRYVAGYTRSTDHVRIVPNGFRHEDALAYRHRQVLQADKPLQIVSVSNLVAGKGVDINLAALGKLKSLGHSSWHYHVVGDGPLKPALESQARANGIEDNVTFHGRCAHDHVYRLLGACDIFSLPSAPEAFGIAYLEAMACGLLAIGVRGEGPTAFIDSGRNGFLISDRSFGAMAALLQSILERPAEFAPLAAAGREHVWRNFTWEAHARALTDVFEEARQSLAGRRPEAAEAHS